MPSIEGKLKGARNTSPFWARNARQKWARFLVRAAHILRPGGHGRFWTPCTGGGSSKHRSTSRPPTYCKGRSWASKVCTWTLHRRRNSQAASDQVGRQIHYRRPWGLTGQDPALVEPRHRQKSARFLGGPSLPREQLHKIEHASGEPNQQRPLFGGLPPPIRFCHFKSKYQHSLRNAK